LIVDEVLAVGDAEFQKKCLGKMGDISKGEGRTVLFVSHNMDAVASLTSRAIFLKNGELASNGPTTETINHYLLNIVRKKGVYMALPKAGTPSITSIEVIVSEEDGTQMNGKNLMIDFEVNIPEVSDGMALSFQIVNQNGIPVIYSYSFDVEQAIFRKVAINKMRCLIPKCNLYANIYYLTVHLAETKGRTKYEVVDNICEFEVVMPNKIIEWGWQKDVCIYTEEFIWKTIN